MEGESMVGKAVRHSRQELEQAFTKIMDDHRQIWDEWRESVVKEESPTNSSENSDRQITCD
jgi:hypothetical protein